MKHSLSFPQTEVVILAGGQAKRMLGVNKLLQTFDDQIQLVKIYQHLSKYVGKVWVNSHRDLTLYRRLIPTLGFFNDDVNGFLGPLMGIKTAWSHVKSDYILFVPCDVTYIPPHVLTLLHQKLSQAISAQVVYLEINGEPLYPFCLMKRSSVDLIHHQLEQGQYSLKWCFSLLGVEKVMYEHDMTMFHSINSLDELQQYRQARYLA
ncbi:molybdenum cofactor guanylyltransferase [Acinetobacter rathckeae]|uniref:molybdenum cofactor guanylyltransferase n=1 Tax=Acinetobacter rathckeae TaxID=2605272 RepID=UPI0018A2FB4C|nr:NTP transferase domain-containing protein [Acinetobacter rathckeae]MBF7687316.1 NTP transferase domain-containing protein [Acinetobacter rathckeae]MBF7696153.1 NTP transferase domain-containing protein [Acinetobacter rathckeae]